MRPYLKAFLVIAIVLMAVIPGAYGITLSASMGSGGTNTDTVGNSFNTQINSAVSTGLKISDLKVDPLPITITGSFNSFAHNHYVTDNSGNHAEIHAKVLNGNNLNYYAEVVPTAEQTGLSYVLAQQWLDVGNANSIICSQSASDAAGNNAGSSISINPNYQNSQGNTVSGSLSGYHGWAGAGSSVPDAGVRYYPSDPNGAPGLAEQHAEAGQSFDGASGTVSVVASEQASDEKGNSAAGSITINSGSISGYSGESSTSGDSVIGPGIYGIYADRSFYNAQGKVIKDALQTSDELGNNAGASMTISGATNGNSIDEYYGIASPGHSSSGVPFFVNQGVLAGHSFSTDGQNPIAGIIAEEHASDLADDNAGASISIKNGGCYYTGFASAGIGLSYKVNDEYLINPSQVALAIHMIDAGGDSVTAEEHSSDILGNKAGSSLIVNGGYLYKYGIAQSGVGSYYTSPGSFFLGDFDGFNPNQAVSSNQLIYGALGNSVTAEEHSSDVAGDKVSESTAITGIPATKTIVAVPGELGYYLGSSSAGFNPLVELETYPNSQIPNAQMATAYRQFYYAGGESGSPAAKIVTNEQVSNKVGASTIGITVTSGNLFGYSTSGGFAEETPIGSPIWAANGYGAIAGHYIIGDPVNYIPGVDGKMISITSSTSNALDGSKYGASTTLTGTDAAHASIAAQDSMATVFPASASIMSNYGSSGAGDMDWGLTASSVNSVASASFAGNSVNANTVLNGGSLTRLQNGAYMFVPYSPDHKQLIADQKEVGEISGNQLTLDATATNAKKKIDHPLTTVISPVSNIIGFENTATVDLVTGVPLVTRTTTTVPPPPP